MLCIVVRVITGGNEKKTLLTFDTKSTRPNNLNQFQKVKIVTLIVNLNKTKEMNSNGRRDIEEKGLIWKLPQIKLKDLGKVGPAFGAGIGCGVGVGVGLVGGIQTNKINEILHGFF